MSQELKRDLLVEIGTEELPPKSLEALSEAFLDGICAGLENRGLDYLMAYPFATPRRLAVLVKGVDVTQADQAIERRGPALKAAYDAAGKPSKAAEGFARSCGVDMAALETLETDKGAWLVYRSLEPGKPTAELVPTLVQDALDALPIPKRMRWGDRNDEFVRPVHWLVLLLGDTVIEAELLGVKSDRLTRGHRFHHPEPISIPQPADYAKLLEKQGHVIPVFSVRQARVQLLVEEAAETLDDPEHSAGSSIAVIDEALLKEVTSLVEWPVAVVGQFDLDFLQVPPPALIAAMKGHQKYFHVVDKTGQLLPYFIAISNLESRQPALVQAGNERVIRPRLSDAAFFWQQDQAHSLESRLESLKTVVFENKLGSLYDRSQRIATLSGQIAAQLGGDARLGLRAGRLCKCDLLSAMVGEFPELQGIMGEYYARHGQEDPAVAVALREHYLPRYWGDTLPETVTGQAVALADRLDTLVGIFGIGKMPSGDKDPYGLRRAAISVLRICIEQQLPLDLFALLDAAAAAYPPALLGPDTAEQVLNFVLERLPGYYQEQGTSPDSIDAVLSCRPHKPLDAHWRIQGVESFRRLPAAAALAEANKRIHNLLKKVTETLPAQPDPAYFKTPEEQALYQSLSALQGSVAAFVTDGDYQAALHALAALQEPVDNFFTAVMVMTDDQALRVNRLALLAALRGLFLQVADISRLSLN